MSSVTYQGAPNEAESVSSAVRTWLITLCGIIVLLIVFGGFVRLSHSGLSMVEWNIVTGISPPIGDAQWQEAFEKYQLTPEYLLINRGFSLPEYRTIYLIEYTHRLIARSAGLVVLIPLAIFLFRGTIPLRRSGPYISIAGLFVAQGLFGWYMVKSGLIDEPQVSPFRLTVHLLIALALLGLCMRQVFQISRQTLTVKQRPAMHPSIDQRSARWSLVLLGLIVVQIAYGGLVAGFKAGNVSDTFPLMFGTLIPSELLSLERSWWVNLVANEVTVHFVHRWFAFVPLIGAFFVYSLFRKSDSPESLTRLSLLALILIGLQIVLGILVILYHVPLPVALIHQTVGVLIFASVCALNYRLLYRTA